MSKLPAQRLSAGQENGLRTGWLIQPGAPEMVLAREEKTAIVLFASACGGLAMFVLIAGFSPQRRVVERRGHIDGGVHGRDGGEVV